MNKIKILIVDDEPLAHEVLIEHCCKFEDLEVVGNCYDGISTSQFVNKHEVDLILLDIQMPDITGFELLDILKYTSPKIIFTTAFTDYALQSFEYDQVIDYLLKPVRIDRFAKAMNRLKKQLKMESTAEDKIEELQFSKKEPLEFISLKDNRVVHKVSLKEILYVQSWGNYLKVFLENDDIKLVRMPIKTMEEELRGSKFVRIHKSYLVNTIMVKRIIGNQIWVANEIILPIGKSYVVSVKLNLI